MTVTEVDGNDVAVDGGAGPDLLPDQGTDITVLSGVLTTASESAYAKCLIENDFVTKRGTLSTRAGDDSGEATVPAGHRILEGDLVDVSWNQGARSGMTAGAVTDTVVPLDGGSGDALPEEGTAVILDPLTLSLRYQVSVTILAQSAGDQVRLYCNNKRQYMEVEIGDLFVRTRLYDGGDGEEIDYVLRGDTIGFEDLLGVPFTIHLCCDDHKITAGYRVAGVGGSTLSVPVVATSSICGVGTGAINGDAPVFDDFTLRYLQQDVQLYCPSCGETCIYLYDSFPGDDLSVADWEVISGTWNPFSAPQAEVCRGGVQTSSTPGLMLANTALPDPPDPEIGYSVSTQMCFTGTGVGSEARLVADYQSDSDHVYVAVILEERGARYEAHVVSGGNDTTVFTTVDTRHASQSYVMAICFYDGILRIFVVSHLDIGNFPFYLADIPYAPSTSRVGLWANPVPDYYGMGPIRFSYILASREKNTQGDCSSPCAGAYGTGCNECTEGTWRHTIRVRFDGIGPGQGCDDCIPPWIVDLEYYSALTESALCKWTGHKPDPCGDPDINYPIECTIASIPSGYRITITVGGIASGAVFVRDIIAESLDCTDLAGPVSQTATGSDTNCDWSAATCEILDSFD
jgi:hypothetical protein